MVQIIGLLRMGAGIVATVFLPVGMRVFYSGSREKGDGYMP
jgi:hypothetical protein